MTQKPQEIRKPRTIRFPDEVDAWIESRVTPYRSFSSLVIEMAVKAKEIDDNPRIQGRAGGPTLADKQKTGALRK